jgi:hypothetical protein
MERGEGRAWIVVMGLAFAGCGLYWMIVGTG